MRRLGFALALCLSASPAIAQTVPTAAQCDAKKADAVAWRKAVFNARMVAAGTPWLAMGSAMDEYLWAEEGVKALACRLAAGTPTTSTGPTYADGYKAGIAAAAARAASTPPLP